MFYQQESFGKAYLLYGSAVPLAKVSMLLHAIERTARETGTDTNNDVADSGLSMPGQDYSHTQKQTELYHAAIIVRAEIDTMQDTIPWLPSPADIAEEAMSIPHSLFNLLAWIIAGSEDAPVASSPVSIQDVSDRKRVLSVCQDIVFCARKGRIKQPKHVALPMAVYHLTRSMQIVSLLSSFGHGISPCQLAEVDTTLAQQRLTTSTDLSVLPSNVSRSAPATFCFDNFDMREETRTGGGTLHCTNGIVVQPTLDEAERLDVAAQSTLPIRTSSRRPRSLKMTAPTAPVLHLSKARKGPGLLPFDADSIEAVGFSDVLKKALRRPFPPF